MNCFMARLLVSNEYELKHINLRLQIFTARRYASAVYAVALCPFVFPSVTSRSSTKTVGSRKQGHTVARDSSFLMPKILVKFEWGHPNRSAKCRWGGLESEIFD